VLTCPPPAIRSLQELRPELLQELAMNACLNGKAFLVEHGDLLEFVGNRWARVCVSRGTG
jgi:hypothetical protein